ncbi:MAG: chemotaxis protein CheD [Spirochaetota bacterium]
MNLNVTNVGIGDILVCSEPGVLRTVLGSCVALCMYDIKKKIAGLAHVVLPRYNGRDSRSRFADTAYTLLLERLCSSGARKKYLVARLAGGARMFIVSNRSPFADIGTQNASVLRESLNRDGIPLLSENIGGERGMVVTFASGNGTITIRLLGQ